MTTLRWGILGTARISRRLIPAFQAARRSTLVAVASRDRDRASAHAARWHIPRALAGYDTLLADDGIDAVYVPLPNSEHVRWTLGAIDAGKHVLCEKPLALDPADVERIATAARARGVIVEDGFMYPHEPLTAKVRELVSSGAVGAVRAIVSGFTFALDRPGDVRLDPALGGGALWDIGCYPVTYARMIAGRDPTVVFGSAHWSASGVDEEFTGLLRFTGGATATVYASFTAAYRTWLEVIGSEGVLTVPNPFRPEPLETLDLTRQGKVERIEVIGSDLLFLREVEDFEASVLDRAPSVVSLDDSLATTRTLAGLYASARGTSALYPQ